MKAIMVMFDSLNRHMLPPYGCDWVNAPNFQRLAEKTVTFERAYTGSLPCMPARRELHTGRYNFLHRSWGPLEPFDDSMPELLKRNGIPSHLISDHYHYWEEGGCTYHTSYSNWQISRGQEGDAWMADFNEPDIPEPNPVKGTGAWGNQDWINRAHMQDEEDQPQAKTFQMGVDYINRNHSHDNWFLQIETFDPHEPYVTDEHYKELYDFDFSKFKDNDWPGYRPVEGPPELTEHYRNLNAALISMCDKYLGKVLDLMDEHDMWKDTMLIVNTDHGFLLGEHDWWGKCRMPFYNEITNMPFFVWDPRSGKCGERRESLVQTIDIAPTILDFFGIDIPEDMQGVPLKDTVADDKPVRQAALFGMHGGHVNCTDGRYVYMRAPANAENEPLYNYTVMPTHMRSLFGIDELKTAEMHEGFSFTKGCPVMRIDSNTTSWTDAHSFGTMLFDLESDPKQENPIQDSEVEAKMIDYMVKLMKDNDTPPEQFERLGLDG